MPGVSVTIDAKKCRGCETCVKKKVCYVQAISIRDGKARIVEGLCKGCGRCVQFCPEKAIRLEIEDSEFMRHTIERIAPLVDVVSD